tara:strand:+ start:2881 stop:3630 length:750 start_codon:yes stop_codon:yes gene_type:complete
MKKIITIGLLLFSINFVYSDDHITIGGMNALQCQFADGKDMDDVMNVLDEWNEYGDENFSEPFSAWVMTPVYMSNADFDLDFVFLGFADSLSSIGKAEDEFRKGGQRIGEKWERVTDCSGMSLNMNVEARSPKNDWVEGGINYTMIQSCSFKDGKSANDLQANDAVWNKYLDESGFEGGYWRWWPETGSPTDTDYDYLLAVDFSSIEQYGASRDNRLQAMMAGTRPDEIHECNTPRLYESTNIRLRQAD